tara:strand:+ start:1341 stop:2078 length:738 start_codon:yes stop_codon:yes gene_type:complete
MSCLATGDASWGEFFERLENKKLNIHIVSLLHGRQTFVTQINETYTLLDLLKFLLQQNPVYALSSFKIATKIKIGIENALEPLWKHISRNDNECSIYLHEMNMLMPKNCLEKTGVIIDIYNKKLEKTLNLNGVCLINHEKIGAWDDFGKGPTSVPSKQDNRVKNLLFITYNGVSYAYNLHCLIEMIVHKKNYNINTDDLIIPHLNKKIKARTFLEKIDHFMDEILKSSSTSTNVKSFVLNDYDFV